MKKLVLGVAVCFGISGVNGMNSNVVAYKLEPSVIPEQLYLGSYDEEFTIKTIRHATEIISKINLLDRTNAKTLHDSLTKINEQQNRLCQEERLAFNIYLMGITFNVLGEGFSPESDFQTIAQANVLVKFVNSIDEFIEKWEKGAL